ncbi:hypothetical protein D3C80_1284240 [compost metagenome]
MVPKPSLVTVPSKLKVKPVSALLISPLVQTLVISTLHSSKLSSTKSFSAAVKELEERVSAMKLLKQPSLPPTIWLRLIPPSKKLSKGKVPLVPLLGV